MNPLVNIDLFSVGVTVAASLILGIAVFVSNRRSATNIYFLLFALCSTVWSVVNYLSYQTTDPDFKLWTIRLVLFFAAFHAYSFFMLMRVFPNEKNEMSPRWKWGLLLVTCLVALLTLSPLVFAGVVVSSASKVAQPVPAPGIAAFGLLVITLIISGIVLLIQKIRRATTRLEKTQFVYLLIGVVAMFSLIIIFEFILPSFLENIDFVPLAAVFILPFIAATAYAIFRHHLLSVKVISTEILAFALTIVTFSEIIFAQTLLQIIFRSGEFILVLIISIFLIQSVIREVEQREELEKLDKELEEKNTQLEDLSRFKTQLLSLASHQMKSPLAAIKGFGALLIEGQMGVIDAKGKETVAKMVKSADGLVALINTLLDLRKVEEGKMEYQFARVDMTKLAQDMFDMLKPLADAKKLDFTFVSPGHEVWVNADADKLKQVIQNITDNAIKYTPSGFVKLSLVDDVKNGATTAHVSVTDSGVGFSPDLAPHLFEEFVRDERVKKQILGTGLGLYIARRIAEAHGGTIWAESPGEGKGSTFNLTVPEVPMAK